VSVEADSAKTGLKTLVAEMHDPAAAVPGAIDGEQLSMLPLDRKIAEKNLPTPRGPGRPPGAKNKNTEEWRTYLLSRYSSPLEGLAQTYSIPIEDICAMLNCTKLEAFKLQLQAMKELAPYVHQKMPLALDVGDQGLISLFINALPQSAAQVGNQAEGAVIEVLNEPQQNQLLNGKDVENSNVPISNAEDQSIETTGQNDDATD